MSENQPNSETQIWQLAASTAQLSTSQLSGQIDLGNPLQGLHQLTYRAKSLTGSVLGVARPGSLNESSNLGEVVVRNDDLIVSFRETESDPFSLQVYWTVSERENGIVLIDTLLSIETTLLESFPTMQVKSELACEEIWNISGQAEPIQLNSDANQQGHGCLVLRAHDETWSYAEMAHPEDPGDWQLSRAGTNECLLQRELGGTFIEKGVVHRMRLRGALLPRQDDLQLAAECLADLAAEAPPLTA